MEWTGRRCLPQNGEPQMGSEKLSAEDLPVLRSLYEEVWRLIGTSGATQLDPIAYSNFEVVMLDQLNVVTRIANQLADKVHKNETR
jgi:hypothetical protein